MTIAVSTAAVSNRYDPGGTPSEDRLAAIAFLARYSGGMPALLQAMVDDTQS